MRVRSTVERLRQPEYTGENRCIPCTAVNLVIAGVLGIGLAVVSIPVGIAAFVGSVGAISLRGYLVPGTSALTKRYFPDWVLKRFDKLPESPGGGAVAGATSPASRQAGEAATDRAASDVGDTEAVEDVGDAGDEAVLEPEAALNHAGAIAPCEHTADLCLAPDFRAAWRDRITDLREQGVAASDARDALGVTDRDAWVTDHADGGSLSRDGDAITLEPEGETGVVAQWESEAALLADVTGAELLSDRLAGWDRLDVDGRSRLLYALRLFVETCPECDGPVSLDGEVVTSCCRAMEVAVVTCEDCGARLFEQQ